MCVWIIVSRWMPVGTDLCTDSITIYKYYTFSDMLLYIWSIIYMIDRNYFIVW